MTTRASTNRPIADGVFERIATLEAENEHLRIALESRIIIEQAKGAVSVRCGVTPDTAFQMMRGLARSHRRDLHEYAAEIVANGGRLGADE